MRAAKFEKSPRLQRVHRVLSDGLPHSTRDIIHQADVCAVNSCIAELRENGFSIDCKVEDGIHHYIMEVQRATDQASQANG